MKVLVAGASGLIGREVVRLLVEAGHGVRTLSQNAERAERLRALTGDVRLADATKEGALRGVCQGIDVVVSALGAPVLPGAGTPRSFGDVDRAANERLLAEAARAGVRRFVYVGVYTTPAYSNTAYVRAHTEVERRIRESGLEHGFVRTTGVFGALAELVNMARKGPVPLIGNGGAKTNPVHETDVAECVLRAVVAPGSTEVELGGPETLTRRHIAELAFHAWKKAPKLVVLPVWLMRVVAWFYGIANRRMAELLAFVIPASTTDCVATAGGARKLGAYFEEVAARTGTAR
jgi:uncharacterized protein YbjT (DUF2867 family)